MNVLRKNLYFFLSACVTSGWLKTPKGCECTEEKLIFFSLNMCNIWQQWPCSALFDTFATLVYVRGWPGLCQRMTWFMSEDDLVQLCCWDGVHIYWYRCSRSAELSGLWQSIYFMLYFNYPLSLIHTHTYKAWVSERQRERECEWESEKNNKKLVN